MALELLPLSQPEIEVERYRYVVDQGRFCDESSVKFFEVCGQQRVALEELGTEGLLAKLRTDASGNELRVKVFLLHFEKQNGRSTGRLAVTSDDFRELVERIGISKAFVQRALEPQIWDGNN